MKLRVGTPGQEMAQRAARSLARLPAQRQGSAVRPDELLLPRSGSTDNRPAQLTIAPLN